MTTDTDKQSGFEPDDVAASCTSYDHNPPTMLYIPPGQRYRHVCPACGAVTLLRPHNFTFGSQA